MKSEQIIVDYLRSHSDYALQSEEGHPEVAHTGTRWVIDPLDGTTNYARGIPICAISIALMHHGEVLLGVVLDPFNNHCYYAERGSGAFLNHQRIVVSNVHELPKSVLYLDYGYGNAGKLQFVSAVAGLAHWCVTRSLGSTALEYCLVARGSVEGLLTSGDALWDNAAGVLLVQEAGGTVTDWKAETWTENTESVFASNGQIHSQVVALLQS